MATRGDDLEDDYAPDDLVADSDVDDEGYGELETFAPLDGEEDQFVLDDHSNSKLPTAKADSAKRKAIDNADATREKKDYMVDEAKRDKKRKKRAKDNERKAKVHCNHSNPLFSLFDLLLVSSEYIY